MGAFDVAGWDILEGVVEAAETMRSPIILSVPRTYPGTENIESLARAVIDMGRRATIPVAFQVEVDETLQAAKKQSTWAAADWYSTLPHIFCRTMRPSQKVVALAAARNVLVVGQVVQLENDQLAETAEPGSGGTTSPLEAKYYVERTGVDCLAVSVNRISSSGNKYDCTRLSKINQTVGIPLGIHGSAGLTDEQMRRMIGFGAAKINYNTVLHDVAARRIRENAMAGAEGYEEIMEGVRVAVKLEAERCVRV